MQKKCFIVDDEIDAIEILSDYIQDTPGLIIDRTETNATKAYKLIQNKEIQPDIIFLDVNMPVVSGLTIAKIVEYPTRIIFSTAHLEYAKDAFDIDAVDFLHKPFTYERFLKSIAKITTERRDDNNINLDFLFFKVESNGKYYKVNIHFDDLLRIEGMNNYVKIFISSDKFYIHYASLMNVMAKLPSNMFIRCHKSHIINLKFINKIESKSLTMKDGTVVPIGQTYRKADLFKL